MEAEAVFDIKQTITTQWNDRARTFDMSPGHGIHSEAEKQAWLNLLKNALPGEGLRVADLGCGTGALALLLAELGHQTTGLDVADNMLDLAREKAASQGLTVDFRLGDAEDPPFEAESLDAVVSRHVVWSLPNPETAFANWKRLLKPGGAIVTIDGPWGSRKRKLWQEAWRYLAMPLVLATELRDPRMKHKKLHAHLPMRQTKRPEADIEMLGGLGFECEVENVTIPRTYSALNFLKYGYGGHSRHQFVLKAVKHT